MKSIIYIFLGILIISFSSCKDYIEVDDCTIYDYSDCETTKFDEAFIDLFLTINAENQNVPYEIYEGTADEGKLIIRDTADTEQVRHYGVFDQLYSVKAIYKKGDKTISVIDGDTPERWDQDVCDSTCWHYEDIELDLTLKE